MPNKYPWTQYWLELEQNEKNENETMTNDSLLFEHNMIINIL